MAILSDVDIRRAMKRGAINLTPFDEDSLTPVGYDIRVGDFAVSLTTGTLITAESYKGHIDQLGYNIPPHETVLILSMESVRVSRRIAGTFHSMVLPVTRGLTSISTTLDPCWTGNLWLTMTNLSDRKIFLDIGERITTLIFSRLETPTKKGKTNDIKKFREIIDVLIKENDLSPTLQIALSKASETVKGNHKLIEQGERNERGARSARRRRLITLGGILLVLVLLSWGAAVAIISNNGSNIVSYVAGAVSAVLTLITGGIALEDSKDQ